MTFDIVNFTLASALAVNGTVTVGYPVGRTKGDYDTWNTKRHTLVAGQNVYTSPANFTITFNADASNITLTNIAMGSLPASTPCVLQLDRIGPDSYNSKVQIESDPAHMTEAQPYLIDLGSPNALSSNGIAASQSSSGSGNALALNGTGAAVSVGTVSGSVILDVARNVTAAWTGTAVATVSGLDYYGAAMHENSGSGTSFTGKKAFKTVLAITFSAAVTSATAGYGDVLGLPIAVQQSSQIIAEIIGGVSVGGRLQKTRLPWSLNQVDLLAGSTNSAQIIAPFAGIASKVASVVRKAITTGGTLTFQDGATAFVGGVITIANSAVQGAKQEVTPTKGDASLVVAKGDVLQVVPASFATAGEVDGYIEITPTDPALVSGTLVGAVSLLATATTGDVRGTYTPELANDGTTSVNLVVMVPDRHNTGIAQF